VKRFEMEQRQIHNIILNHLNKYNSVKIGVFGSFARGEKTPDSDIDVLVEFEKSPSLLTLIKIENELSEILGIKVDLANIIICC